MSLPTGWIVIPSIINRNGQEQKPEWCKKTIINTKHLCLVEECDFGSHRGARLTLVGGARTDTRLTIDKVAELISQACEESAALSGGYSFTYTPGSEESVQYFSDLGDDNDS